MKVENQLLDLKKDLLYSLQIMNSMFKQKMQVSDEQEKQCLDELNAHMKRVLTSLLDEKGNIKELYGCNATISSPSPSANINNNTDTDSSCNIVQKDDLVEKMGFVSTLFTEECKYKINVLKEQGEKTKNACETSLMEMHKELYAGFDRNEAKVQDLISSAEAEIKDRRKCLKNQITELEKFVAGAKKEECEILG